MHQEPFFLFLNYMDTHTPYQPPRPFDRYFLDNKNPQFYRLTQYFSRLRGKHDKSLWDSYLLSQYDGEVAYLDTQLGELFSQLKTMGIYDSSLIVITSDHGELLGEQGLYGHHENMYEGVLKVPLIIKYPFSKRVGREKRLVNLIDVFPTVLSICDLPRVWIKLTRTLPPPRARHLHIGHHDIFVTIPFVGTGPKSRELLRVREVSHESIVSTVSIESTQSTV